MSSVVTFPQPDLSTLEKAKEYFSCRPNYTLGSDQIDYSNEETGCGFTVDFDKPNNAVCFVLNYNRPKPFIREGVGEVLEFNKAFPGKFINEETEILDDFEPDRYLAGWARVNDDFIREYVGGHDGFGQAFVSTALVEKAWAWNSMRDAHMDASEEDIFIAQVMWLRTSTSNAVPFSMWTETIPTTFPAFVERVAIGTSETSSQSGSTETRNVLRFVPIETVLTMVDCERRIVNGIPAYFVGTEIPAALLQALQFVSPGKPKGEYLIHPSLVLEAEVLSFPSRVFSN